MRSNSTINYKLTIRDALQKLETMQLKALICIDENKKLMGVIVDGDIRRGLLNGKTISDSIETVMNTKPIFLNKGASKEEINSMISGRIRLLPIVDAYNTLVDYHIFREQYDNTYIKNKSISILGMGYVGLTFGLVLADLGYKILGFDINKKLIDNLRKKKEPFFEEGLKSYLDKQVGNRINFTTELSEVLADVYIITVGTPLLPIDKKPDIEYIKKAAFQIASRLKRGDLVILRSTVPTGVSRKVVLPVLEEISSLKCGEDFYFAFAPERTAEGVALRELRKNPQIIGAYDTTSYEITARIFETMTPTVINVKSLEAAETCKLIDNTYRDHNFAYANNMARVTEKLGLNFNKLADAVNFGYKRNQIPKPSPGVGGPCLSKDPYILSEVFKENKLDSKLIMEARKINEIGPQLIKKKLEKLLSTVEKTIEHSKITLIGMAFKGEPETSDLRDSTSLWLMNILDNCKNLNAYDPIISSNELKKIGINPVGLKEAFDGVDAVLIMNNHKSYRNWNLTKLFESMNKPAILIDSWNNFDPMDIKQHEGVLYGGLGND
jgi:UDP-N-acetyl-D-mannosaminuronic acid dehydrogenase